jgi:hypothetical protein
MSNYAMLANFPRSQRTGPNLRDLYRLYIHESIHHSRPATATKGTLIAICWTNKTLRVPQSNITDVTTAVLQPVQPPRFLSDSNLGER